MSAYSLRCMHAFHTCQLQMDCRTEKRSRSNDICHIIYSILVARSLIKDLKKKLNSRSELSMQRYVELACYCFPQNLYTSEEHSVWLTDCIFSIKCAESPTCIWVSVYACAMSCKQINTNRLWEINYSSTSTQSKVLILGAWVFTKKYKYMYTLQQM